MSHFEVVYGKPPPTVVQYLQGSTVVAVYDLLSSRESIHASLQRRLRKVQEAMKVAADKHRRDLAFQVGDWVYVRLRPFRQTSVAPSYSKLAKRFYGPFEVVERVGPVAYRLWLIGCHCQRLRAFIPCFMYPFLSFTRDPCRLLR